MLQDLNSGRLENEYRKLAARGEDMILCFRGSEVLLSRLADDTLTLPAFSDMAAGEGIKPPRYLFRMEGRNFFLWTDTAPMKPKEGFAYEPVRPLRQLTSKEVCFAVMTGWHLYNWYRTNCLCGCCGTPTEHDSAERMLRCVTMTANLQQIMRGISRLYRLWLAPGCTLPNRSRTVCHPCS